MSESVNTAMLDELKELLEEGFLELVNRFLSDGQDRIEKITAAIKANDSESLYIQAHGLKGSSRNMGADTLADICDQLESMGQSCDIDSPRTIVATLETEFAVAVKIISQYE